MSVEAGEAAVAIRVVYAATAAYAALFVFAAVIHFVVFKTPRLDLGDMVQAVWSTRHGHFLQFTSLTGYQRDRFGFHVDPFLLLFVPLFWICSSPVLLLVAQVLAVASGVLPVFWLARKHLGSPRAAVHFAFAYLLYPATQANVFTPAAGFHSVSFAVPLILYAVWFLDENRLVAFSVVAALASTTKEEIPLAVGCLGIWYAVRQGRRAFGFSVFGIGLALTLFNFLWLIPHFSPTGADPYAGRYGAVGGTPEGIAHKLLSDPGAFAHAIATGHKALYLALLFLPFLGLWLVEPLLLLGALPDTAINLLSSKPDQTSIEFQYTAGIIPFVVAASIFGAMRFRNRAHGLSLLACVGTGVIAILSPLLFLGSDLKAVGSPVVSAERHALSLIPKAVPVSASNQLGGYLSERRDVYEFPYVRRARWIIVDSSDPTEGDPAGFKRYVRSYRAKGDWQTMFSSHGIAVFHKSSTGRG